MNRTNTVSVIIIAIITVLLNQGCATTKVTNYWKNDKASIEEFRQQKIFVIARTNSNLTRATLEQEILMQLGRTGVEGVGSYQKFPSLQAEAEMTEDRINKLKEVLANDGFGGVIMVSVKDKQETTTTTQQGGYMGAGRYPGYYGGFYDYYRQPYMYGSYYNGFSSNMSSSTSTSTTYVLETVAYNMNAPDDQKLVFVTYSDVTDPSNIDKAAKEYVYTIVKKLEEN